MDKYKENIDIITTNTSITRDEIFDYADSPMYNIFNSFYEYYSYKLNQYPEFEIKPNCLYFRNRLDINAAAFKKNDFFLISINMGLISHLNDLFNKKDDLLMNTDNQTFIEFEKKLDVPVHLLMYQNACHFTFYHEMGHIVQRSKLLENKICEMNDSNYRFSYLKHILELDADKFSAICIGTHVISFLVRHFEKSLNREDVEKVLVIICSSALYYVLSFPSNKHQIYFKENSHPHPIIRVALIVYHIVGFVKHYFDSKQIIVDLDSKKIITDTFSFSNNLSQSKFKNDSIVEFINVFENQKNEINTYIKEFETLQLTNENLSANKWNKRAKMLQKTKKEKD